MNEMKNELLNFIKKECPEVDIVSVNHCELKKTDDDDGYIDQHYIVSLDVNRYNPHSTKCLVDVKAFEAFCKKSVIWLE